MTIVIQSIDVEVARKAGVGLSVARADLIHPLASGNKIYKLRPNLAWAKQQGYTEVLSFGGAFSNHIHALALLAEDQGLKSIGVIRGEVVYAKNPTLQDAQAAGMQLTFVTRQEYRRRADSDFLKALQNQYPNAYIIPEGGSSQLAVKGCKQLMEEINAHHTADYVCLACGTGATFAGVVTGLNVHQTGIGYAILNDKSLPTRVQEFINKGTNSFQHYKIEAADFGGYAKLDVELLKFINDFLDQTGILLDPIYTSKMVMRLMQQIEQGEFAKGSSIMIIHTGGLQGWRGMKKRVIQLTDEHYWNRLMKHLKGVNR